MIMAKLTVPIGRQTVVSSTSGKTTGRVRLEGAWWTARTRGEPLHKGQQVRVVALDDLTVGTVNLSSFGLPMGM
jgi:membrane protein implicated in regulation of membrane protease activity